MIIVKNSEGLRIFHTTDHSLLPDLQALFPDPPHTIVVNPPDAGTLASPSEIHNARMQVIRRRINTKRIALEQDLQNASTVPQVKLAVKNMFDFTLKVILRLAEE